MRKTLLLIVFATVFFFLHTSFADADPKKQLRKNGFIYVPSGAYVNKGDTTTIMGFYMLATEITNLEYREFLLALKKAGRMEDFAKANIDSTKWRIPNSIMEEFVKSYATDPAFDNYPAVNMSQEGAYLYCKWLQEKYAADGIKVYVRMPLEIEWKYAAKGGRQENMYAWQGEYLRNKKGVYQANFKTDKVSEDGGYITVKTNSYKANDFGLFNMCGNVSEWVQEEAVAKGGNWNSSGERLKIEAADEFSITSGSPFIGFRPVLVLLSK